MTVSSADNRRHHVSPVEVDTPDGPRMLCPHCGVKLEEKDLYVDRKGWAFCRICFRKGRGAVRVKPEDDGPSHEKKATPWRNPYAHTTPVNHNATSVAEQKQRIAQTRAVNRGLELHENAGKDGTPTPVDPNAPRRPNIWPSILSPIVGAGIGTFLDDDPSLTTRALRGAITGTSGLLGAETAWGATGGDTGAGLTGWVGGATAGSLLARNLLLPPTKPKPGYEDADGNEVPPEEEEKRMSSR